MIHELSWRLELLVAPSVKPMLSMANVSEASCRNHCARDVLEVFCTVAIRICEVFQLQAEEAKHLLANTWAVHELSRDAVQAGRCNFDY